MFALQQYGDFAFLFLRIVVGAIFIVHGISKWEMWKMQPSEQMPSSLLTKMRILSIAESLGGLAVLFGFLTQFAAFGLAIIMLGAMDFKIRTLKRSFVDNAGGWELDLILFASLIALVVFGSGVLAIDALLLFV
ncbi:MAG: DoxX family protein [Patescibacteria group bacterium]|jgi:putative oxidoreductase